MVDEDDRSTTCDGLSDVSSDCGASACADFSESDGEKMGFTLWFKDETVKEMLARWLAILDLTQATTDLFPLTLM